MKGGTIYCLYYEKYDEIYLLALTLSHIAKGLKYFKYISKKLKIPDHFVLFDDAMPKNDLVLKRPV